MGLEQKQTVMSQSQLTALIASYVSKGYDPIQTFQYFLNNGYSISQLRVSFKEVYALYYPGVSIPQSIINYPEVSTKRIMFLVVPLLLILGLIVYFLLPFFSSSQVSTTTDVHPQLLEELREVCTTDLCFYERGLDSKDVYSCQSIQDEQLHDACLLSLFLEMPLDDINCLSLHSIYAKDSCMNSYFN